MLVIGESINASIKSVAEAISNRDEAFIADLAKQQVDGKADMLDVNAGTGMRDELEDILWLIRTVQKTVDVPLVLDSSNPEVLVAAYPECQQRPMLSSITLEQHSQEVLLPFIKEHDCQVLGMCVGSGGMPATAQEVFGLAKELIDATGGAGLKPEDLYIDVAVMAVSASADAGLKVLESIILLKEYQPQVHAVCAVSNVSFGLPKRRMLNRTFVPMLAAAGADAFIVDSRDKEMMASIIATTALLGRDDFCINFMKAYREGRL
jgi:5-methyltetrahydrofolate--homocysteine methyltransferase